jgi:hypothetical protein
MIIEIKDLPDQKVKSVDIHIDFLESDKSIRVDYTPKVQEEPEKREDVEIPSEMLDSEF